MTAYYEFRGIDFLFLNFSTNAISQLNARNPQKTTIMTCSNHPHLGVASPYTQLGS